MNTESTDSNWEHLSTARPQPIKVIYIRLDQAADARSLEQRHCKGGFFLWASSRDNLGQLVQLMQERGRKRFPGYTKLARASLMFKKYLNLNPCPK